MSYINSIGTAVPKNKINQANASEWMINALNVKAAEARAIRSLYRSSGIETRFSVIEDYTLTKGEFTFYPNTFDLEPFPTVQDRMKLYAEAAPMLASDAIHDAFNRSQYKPADVTHLICVSCTGMYAPGLDFDLIERLGLRSNVERISIQFMGCYAAFNGLKSADYICRANPDAVVLVICVEICTLHFLKEMSRDQLVANALFGDGAAAAIVSSLRKAGSLSLVGFRSIIAPGTSRHMAWSIEDKGFRMALSSYVPDIIAEAIGPMVERLQAEFEVAATEEVIYAIHPGGKRILEECEQALGISSEELAVSYEVLSNYGNMSSSTILFVLKRLIELSQKQDEMNNKRLLSFAFGPGLTIESAVMSVVNAEVNVSPILNSLISNSL